MFFYHEIQVLFRNNRVATLQLMFQPDVTTMSSAVKFVEAQNAEPLKTDRSQLCVISAT